MLYLDYYNVISLIIYYLMTEEAIHKNMLICIRKSSSVRNPFEENLPNGKFTFV